MRLSSMRLQVHLHWSLRGSLTESFFDGSSTMMRSCWFLLVARAGPWLFLTYWMTLKAGEGVLVRPS